MVGKIKEDYALRLPQIIKPSKVTILGGLQEPYPDGISQADFAAENPVFLPSHP